MVWERLSGCVLLTERVFSMLAFYFNLERIGEACVLFFCAGEWSWLGDISDLDVDLDRPLADMAFYTIFYN